MKDPDAFDFDGRYGRIYDHIARTVVPGYGELLPATLALFRQFLGDEARVLVAGCGTGMETCGFLSREPSWRVTAVDPSAAMIAATHQAAADLGVVGRLVLHHGVADDLPDVPEHDAATLLNVMHFLPDDGRKDGLVRGVAQRVRPGGPLALFDLHGEPGTDGYEILRKAWSDFVEQQGLRGPEKAAFLERIDRGIAWVPESRVLEICLSAGLTLISRYYGGLLYGGWLFVRDAE